MATVINMAMLRRVSPRVKGRRESVENGCKWIFAKGHSSEKSCRPSGALRASHLELTIHCVAETGLHFPRRHLESL